MTAEEAPPATPSPELLAEFPLERWARIVATIDASPAAEPAILEASGLDAEAWEGIDAHWLDAQQRCLENGDTSLLALADDAYLARLEEERGPVTPNVVAEVVVGGELGARDQALANAELNDAASLVVERVWCRRCALDETLAAETDAAIERARAGAGSR